MTFRTVDGFFLGTIYDLDPDESDFNVELAGDLIGQTAGSGTPLYERIEQITLDDPNDDLVIEENDLGRTPEGIFYQGVGSGLDSISEYNVTVTYFDGSTETTVMNIIQDESGRVFLLPSGEGSPRNNVLDDAPIRTVRFDSVFNTNYDGLTRQIEPNAFVVCFLSGTRIATPDGERRIETLCTGDPVMTQDRGAQPVRWIGVSRRRASGKSAPVRFAPNSLGTNRPTLPLMVSQQHRMLVRSPIARRMFGSAEVLVPAKKLLDLEGVTLIETADRVEYYHIMFDNHEIVTANGTPSESFLPGPMGLTAVSRGERLRIDALRPKSALPARQIADTASRVRRFVARHRENDRALVV